MGSDGFGALVCGPRCTPQALNRYAGRKVSAEFMGVGFTPPGCTPGVDPPGSGSDVKGTDKRVRAAHWGNLIRLPQGKQQSERKRRRGAGQVVKSADDPGRSGRRGGS